MPPPEQRCRSPPRHLRSNVSISGVSNMTANILPAFANIQGTKAASTSVANIIWTTVKRGRVAAKEPAGNNAADVQKLVGGPSEPIEHIAWPALIATSTDSEYASD